MSLETEAGQAAEKTIRIPANVMGLLRQSYDSREKVLDWCLAISVAATLIYVFREPLGQMIWPTEDDPNAGRTDNYAPNMNTLEAFPTGARRDIYTYNLPSSRVLKFQAGPTATDIPRNPSLTPTFDTPE